MSQEKPRRTPFTLTLTLIYRANTVNIAFAHQRRAHTHTHRTSPFENGYGKSLALIVRFHVACSQMEFIQFMDKMMKANIGVRGGVNSRTFSHNLINKKSNKT